MTVHDARRVATTFPEAVETTSHDTVAFRVGKTLRSRQPEQDRSLAMRIERT